QLGGLQDAIADARERAGLPPHRKVALLSYGATGSALTSLSPALVGALPALARRERDVRGPRQRLQRRLEVLDPADPLLTWPLHPEEAIWLMDPWVLEVGPR